MATRRSFIKYASLAAAGNAAGLRPFGMLNSMAATGNDYKALVCIFLFGGNDANNTLVPFDTKGYANYASIRGPLTIPQSSLLQLGGAGSNFALNNNLPDIPGLFNSGTLAFVQNVGTVLQPTTRATYLAGTTLPTNLFSHTDQQLEWQNASQSGVVSTGWAGRISDLLTPQYNANASVPLITTVAGDTLFCNGSSSTPMAVSPGNVSGATCSEGTTECAAQSQTAQALLTFSSGLSLVTQDNAITANAYKYAQLLSAAVQSVGALKTVFPTTSIGAQLSQIAQIIQIRSALGLSSGRQIFFASLGNFDTHTDQIVEQGALLAQLSPAMAAFNQATIELAVQPNVTTFTMSDFARTFQPNSNSGSDHAWGSHHMVMGGAVKGGQLYGTFPTLALGGPDDSGSNGRWVPSTGTVQYASTLAQWFGVSSTQLASVFPNVGLFPTNNLGFV